MEQTYDNHTIFLQTGLLEKSQILQILLQGIRRYEQEYQDTLSASFCINVVRNSKGELQQYSWLWVSNPILYHLLVGNNPDGTERMEILKEEDRNFYVEKRLPSLIRLDPCLQSNGVKCTIQMRRGDLKKPGEDFVSNQIRNSKHTPIPNWLTRTQIREIFRPYVTGDREDKTWPKIRVLQDGTTRTVFVEFDPTTLNAASALAMLKRVELTDPRGNPYTISFSYPRRTNVSWRKEINKD